MKIYLAGSMKTGWQDRVIREIRDVHFLDPRTHGLTDEKAYTEWDLTAIRQSDMVLAYMDTANPSGFGMSLEVGFAKALGKVIWYVCEDALDRQRYFGMVRSCADRVYTSLDDVIYKMAFIRQEFDKDRLARNQ